jgi:BolA family transcriptional regulator, general stress-responsive regulator
MVRRLSGGKAYDAAGDQFPFALQGSRMDMKESITGKLAAAFLPSALDVIDESDQHAGHGGWREGQTTHVRVRIRSPAFAGKNRVAIHREINALLTAEFAAGLHALAIEAQAA